MTEETSEYARIQQENEWSDEQMVAFISQTEQVDADYAAFMLAISKGEIDGDVEEVEDPTDA